MTQSEVFNDASRSLGIAAQHLLAPFEHTLSADSGAVEWDERSFCVAFLERANQFAQDCSRAAAAAVRRLSVIATVRGSTNKTLAIQIRNECFEELDLAVVNACRDLAAVDADLNALIAGLSRSEIIGQTIEAALVGGAIGSAFKRPAQGAILGGSIQAAAYEYEEQRRAEESLKLERLAREVAQRNVLCCLKAVEDLPSLFIDCMGAKCFGGDVDLEIQCAAVDQALSAIKPMLDKAACDLQLIVARASELRRVKVALERQTAEKEKRAARIAAASPLKRGSIAAVVTFIITSFVRDVPIWFSLCAGLFAGALFGVRFHFVRARLIEEDSPATCSRCNGPTNHREVRATNGLCAQCEVQAEPSRTIRTEKNIGLLWCVTLAVCVAAVAPFIVSAWQENVQAHVEFEKVTIEFLRLHPGETPDLPHPKSFQADGYEFHPIDGGQFELWRHGKPVEP